MIKRAPVPHPCLTVPQSRREGAAPVPLPIRHGHSHGPPGLDRHPKACLSRKVTTMTRQDDQDTARLEARPLSTSATTAGVSGSRPGKPHANRPLRSIAPTGEGQLAGRSGASEGRRPDHDRISGCCGLCAACRCANRRRAAATDSVSPRQHCNSGWRADGMLPPYTGETSCQIGKDT
jgi:hypothetical protein